MNANFKNKENINLLTIIPALLIVLLVFSGRFKIPFVSEMFSIPIYIGMLFILILIGFIFIYRFRSIHRKSLNYLSLNLLLFTYITARSFNIQSIEDYQVLMEIFLY